MRLYSYEETSSSWILTVDGNTTGGTNFKGDSEPTSTLGDYGVDMQTNIVWAVVDHFTSFGAGELGTDYSLPDAILALQIIAGILPPETIYSEADVNGDGKIGLEEAVYVLEKITGLRD